MLVASSSAFVTFVNWMLIFNSKLYSCKNCHLLDILNYTMNDSLASTEL